MKKKLIIVFISILISLAIAPVAFADVIEPGMKEVNFNYKILNIDNYGDYVFLIHGTPSPLYEIVNSSEFNFYKSSTVSIYAIKKSDFNKIQLSNMSGSEISDFFKNDSRIIKSNIELQGSYKQVSINDPLEKVTVILNITSLNQKIAPSNTSVWGPRKQSFRGSGNNARSIVSFNAKNSSNFLAIQKTKVIYTFTDGTSQEELFKDQNTTPQPSNRSNGVPELWYIVIPVLSMVAIVAILIFRKLK